MSCPHDRHGKPKCHITAHPDRPYDKFCSTCQRRFRDAESFDSLGVLIMILFAFLFLVSIQIFNPSRSQTPGSQTTSFKSI
ncbi:hypothetical protein PCC9214_05564 [Planktothrix tepida]|uniref:hypothetical protein n=2 Tax=Planktothrix tepida TaxID=1678309 RepID=UPI0020B41E2E|nr:hypothetical protein [Planktothrix tepida]CAD5989416.1 hypothetical protein PCC9214_05564 [Planktothrix tepida]